MSYNWKYCSFYPNNFDASALLVKLVQEGMTKADKDFLLSFEEGCPDWSLCSAGDLSKYPSVQWKLLNIRNLKKYNIQKHEQGIKKLKDFLFPK